MTNQRFQEFIVFFPTSCSCCSSTASTSFSLVFISIYFRIKLIFSDRTLSWLPFIIYIFHVSDFEIKDSVFLCWIYIYNICCCCFCCFLRLNGFDSALYSVTIHGICNFCCCFCSFSYILLLTILLHEIRMEMCLRWINFFFVLVFGRKVQNPG